MANYTTSAEAIIVDDNDVKMEIFSNDGGVSWAVNMRAIGKTASGATSVYETQIDLTARPEGTTAKTISSHLAQAKAAFMALHGLTAV